jgi:hypothetical protein
LCYSTMCCSYGEVLVLGNCQNVFQLRDCHCIIFDDKNNKNY